MKKIFSLLVMFLALSCMHVSAQNGANKMIVVNKDGSKSGYIIENLDSIFFAKTPGTASVSLTAGSLVDDELLYPMVRATIKKEDQCQSFRYTVVPKAEADAMVSDADVINYFNTFASKSYTEDLNDEILRNVILSRGTTNTILAVAYDEYNVACSASKADFEIPGDFEITVTDVSQNFINAKVTCIDKIEDYMVGIVENVYGMSDRDIYEKDRAFFKRQFEKGEESFEEIIETASTTKQVYEMTAYTDAGSDYIIYAYRIDTRTGEPTSGITRVPVHTPSIEKTDAKFDISVEITDGTDLDVLSKPVNYDGFYSMGLLEINDNTSDDEIRRNLRDRWLEGMVTLKSMGYGIDEIISSLCYEGDNHILSKDHKANQLYAVGALAVNSDGVIISDLSLIKFKTGKAPKTSENIITFKPERITPYLANIICTCSVPDERFAIYSGPAEEFEGLEGDDLFKYIVDKVGYSNPHYSNDSPLCGPFLPKSKARVYAYGIEPFTGTPTTDLFGIEFETPEVVYDETLTGRLSYGKYYDSKAVAILDDSYDYLAKKGYVFLPADLTRSENAILYTAFFTDKEIKGKTDDEIASMMLIDYRNEERDGKGYRIFRFPYGTEVTGFSLELRDDFKTFGKLYRGEKITIDRAYQSIPQEFVDKYPNTSVTSPAQVNGNTTKK